MKQLVDFVLVLVLDKLPEIDVEVRFLLGYLKDVLPVAGSKEKAIRAVEYLADVVTFLVESGTVDANYSLGPH